MFEVEHKIFPGIEYKDITDFDPKENIKEMKKWCTSLYNAKDQLVSFDIEKNGWNSKGVESKLKYPTLFQFSWINVDEQGNDKHRSMILQPWSMKKLHNSLIPNMKATFEELLQKDLYFV